MTIIPINDKYRIELDVYSWAIVAYEPRKNKSKKQWRPISWHRTLAQAAAEARKRFICETEAKGMDEVLNALTASTRALETAIRESGIPNSWLEAKKLNQAEKGVGQ